MGFSDMPLKRRLFAWVLALPVAAPALAANGVIMTIAGNGQSGYAGDGGPATKAELSYSIRAVMAADGGILIEEEANNVVRDVRPDGTITTVARIAGAGGFGGDGGPATKAHLNQPTGVSPIPGGGFWIADRSNNRVRQVSARGIITTVTGAGVMCANPAGACGDGGPATAARLNTPNRAVPPTLRVQNHQLVNGAGKAVQLRGVNRAVFESRCTYDSASVADGPVDQTSVGPMLAWKINVVRVTLNEDCWLGINGLPLGGNAAGYRAAVVSYVGLLRRNGLYVLLVPESSAPGRHQSTQIDYMPDNDHMPAFWRSVAATFKADHGIVFDPITEVALASWNNPHPNPPGQWNCWLHGCTLDSIYGGRFLAAGLQSLVNVIRSQGATQPKIICRPDRNWIS